MRGRQLRGRKPGLASDENAISDIPKPPAWLSKMAKAEWKRVAPELSERRILTRADLSQLESFCIASATFREAHMKLAKEGLTVHGKRHPAFGIMNAAQTTARLCAAELGLTPTSRSRPALRDDAGDDDLDL